MTLSAAWSSRQAQLLSLRADSLIRNSTAIIGTTIINSALGFAFWLVAARSLDPEVLGLGAGLVSAMLGVSLAANSGATALLIQRLPKESSATAWSTALLAVTLIGLMATLLVAAAAGVLLPVTSAEFDLLRTAPWVLLAFVASTLAWSAGELLDFACVAERRSVFMLMRNATSNGAKLLLLLGAVLATSPGPSALLVIWGASAGIGAVIGALLFLPKLRRDGPAKVKGLWAEVKRSTGPSLGHHVISVGGALPAYVLPVLVTVRLDAAATAYFYLTWMAGAVFFMISPAVSSALFAEGSNEHEGLARQTRQAAKVTALLLVPPVALVVVAGEPLLGVFGSDYARNGYLLFVLLALSAVPDAITNLAVAHMRVQGRLAHATGLNNVMAALALGLAWTLLPTFGIAGVGAAWLVAQASGTVVVVALLVEGRRSGARGGPEETLCERS